MKKFRIAVLACLLTSFPLYGQSGPEARAAAVFDTFLDAMTNTDIATVTSLFREDALFFGTGSQDLVTDPAGVLAYFEPVGRNEPGRTIARARHYETRALSDDLVMISGLWEVVPRGQSEGTPLRVSMLLANRDGRWQIIQFHNSRVPD